MPIRLATFLIVLALSGGFASAQTAADNFNQQQSMQRNQQRMILGQYPPIDKARHSLPASALMTLRVDRSNLVLQTALPSLPQFSKVRIGDSQNWSLILVQGGTTDPAKAVVPGIFSLSRTVFSRGQTETLSVQQNSGSNLSIVLQNLTPEGMHIVQFQQQVANAMFGNPGSCQLAVTDSVNGRMTPLNWTSDNFAALTLEHPAEIDQYLRPILEQIDQQQVLAPDQMLAFELFSDQWAPDAATAAKVNTTLSALTGGDFHSRTRAERALAALGKDAALVLIHLDRTHLDAEQNARIDKVLYPYRPVPLAEAAKLGSAPGFLANCLYSDDLVIRKAAFAKLLAVSNLPLAFDPAADPGSRTQAIATIARQLATAKNAK